jgi:hypothetical protein
MSFIEVLVIVLVGGLLVVSTMGYCAFIFYKYAIKELLKSFETAYTVYLSRMEQTFKENK